jgi:archaellum component FlaG (FlaF/FlaG flagellin family)
LLIAGALFLGLSVHNALGQQPERVDHFQASTFDEDTIKAKVFQLVRKLSEGDQRAKGLIITYMIPTATGRCRDDAVLFDQRVEIAVRDALSELPAELSNRITLRNDDMSRQFQAAFWIVPDMANEPEVQESGYHPFCAACPTIQIRRIPKTANNAQLIEFEAIIDRVCSEDEMKWSVSAGRIVSGQGSQKIRVDVSGESSNSITVTFNLSPWRPECVVCPNEASFTTEIK